MKCILTILLVLSNCASTSHQSLSPVQSVETDYADDTQLKDIHDIATSLTRLIWGDSSVARKKSTELQKWEYEFVDKWIVSENHQTGEITLSDGYTDRLNKRILVFMWQPCLAASSIIHEMIHALGYEHEDKIMFTALPQIQEDIARRLCGPDYKSQSPPDLDKDLIKKVNERQKQLQKEIEQ